MGKHGRCSLCRQDAALVRKSHIIPKFMYRGIYDDMHRMVYLNLHDGKGTFHQTGAYDNYILCFKCENQRLAKLEKYASAILYGTNQKNFNRPQITKTAEEGMDVMNLTGIQYKELNLFLLSIIWRIHISKQQLFESVDLNEKSTTIQEHLLHDQPATETFCKLSIIGLLRKSGKLTNFNTECFNVKNANQDYYFLIVNGFVYLFNFRPDTDFLVTKLYSLQENGTIKIPILHFPHSVFFAGAIAPSLTHPALFD